MTSVTLNVGDVIEFDAPDWMTEEDIRIRGQVLEMHIVEDNHQDGYRVFSTIYCGRNDKQVVAGKREENEEHNVEQVDMVTDNEIEHQVINMEYSTLCSLNFERIDPKMGIGDMAVFDIGGDLSYE